MGLDEIGGGVAVISMPYDQRFVGDPETGVIHGGAVSALMDTCGGAAVMSHPTGADRHRDASTCGSTTCAPPRRASGSPRARNCYHVTRSVAFVRAIAYDDDTDRPVASGDRRLHARTRERGPAMSPRPNARTGAGDQGASRRGAEGAGATVCPISSSSGSNSTGAATS